MTFILPYYVSNNGDGSASARFCATLKEAQKADEMQEGSNDSASTLEIILENGELFIERNVDGQKVMMKLKQKK